MARDGTGQLEEFALKPQPAGPGAPPPMRPRVFSPRPGAKAPFAFAPGHFTGAEAGPDIAVTDPDGAQVLLYPRQPDGGFTGAEKFPSLAEARAIAAGDWDGDGRDELFVGSAREQAASCQRVLGGAANFAHEYATKRYRSNLINWGLLPFTVEGQPFKKGDYVFIPGARRKIADREPSLTAYILSAGAKDAPPEIPALELKTPELTNEEREIVLAGCLINYNRNRLQSRSRKG
jgi:hypothetical protein